MIDTIDCTDNCGCGHHCKRGDDHGVHHDCYRISCVFGQSHLTPDPAKSPTQRWVTFRQQLCDLCPKVARFTHPAGGFRCSKCPKPRR